MENHDGATGRGAEDAYDYYMSIHDHAVQAKFRSLDNPSNINHLMDSVRSTTTNNFILDFSDDAAWAAFDLSKSSIAALFNADRPDVLNTRWLNIWYPFQHRPLLELLARRYDFSPRLLALMSSDPKLPRKTASRASPRKPDQSKFKKFWSRRSSWSEDNEALADIDEMSEQTSISSVDSVVRGNLYRIAENLWHYASIDFGRQYVCIGFNSLYGTKQPANVEDDSTGHLPNCMRVWTWLVLCEDNTVISINEDPFPFAAGHFTTFQLRVMSEIRRNLVNVFRSLSTVHEEPLLAHNPLMLLPIRVRLGETPEETAHRDSDAPGLLFYYLFENWHNSYTLVTRKESRYPLELATLRTQMFSLPRLTHIDRLDTIGLELGILRRHYESYTRLIDRLLEPQTASAASLQNSQVVSAASQVSLSGSGSVGRPVVVERESLMGVSLGGAARVRFKRLRDLIELYALREVEEYVKQKEALVAMNFNLIAIKQSLDVGRLTRITLLLTKATMLFLPVSLMMSYFSTQLSGVSYSVQTFWISFAVVFFLSWLALFLFGLFNDNVQTTEVLRGVWRGGKVVRHSSPR
ncbi:hypothetical protein M409DRAFT_71241 [Zasmidium cellare ATCC 36951]|uniref:ADP-ribosylation factor n=1 Tax=Zasmidium cellare ATCC 36951 TaxID=1080233 RepID=A0A6A6BW93_ZASCE|nr:uncharacterized protein M409DRAFT_71241 [Zasmidium cellare ATCC 36951]KAF2159114.1 hypothetical protein M409DRAFT_71241 [Zasmidium cellare ATCC 36951]